MADELSLSVIGAGSYGTALAIAAAAKGAAVMLYARGEETANRLRMRRINDQYLQDIPFPSTLHITSSLSEAASFAKNILVVVPSSAFVQVLTSLREHLGPEHKLCWATKGISEDGRLLSEVAEEILSKGFPLTAISGPTFARELALGMPTAIAAAGTDQKSVADWCEVLHTKSFRIYESTDFTALQLGGAVKNVIAIGAGLSDGLGYGANARTALITRGLAEMVRLGTVLGAAPTSFMGLSGLGDLILTCTDNQSRNRRFGFCLGRGMNAREALSSIGQVVEGYGMTDLVHSLALKHNIEMPICSEIYAVLYEGRSGHEAARSLLGRALTKE